MHFKRFFLLFFLMSFSLQTKIEAFGFQDLQSFFRSTISWFQTKKEFAPLLAGAVLIGGVSLMHYLRKQAKPDKSEPDASNTCNIQVTPQENETCAYHSLKNGLICYQIAQSNSWVHEHTLFTEPLYCSMQLNRWKRATVKFRKKMALQIYLQNKLCTLLKPGGNPTLREVYKGMLDNIGKGIADAAVEHISTSHSSYEVTHKMILSLITFQIDQKRKDYKKLEGEGKKQLEDNIFKYIDINKGTFNITPKIVNSEFRNKYRNSNDNLEGDELTHLLHLEIDQPAVRDHFSIVDDVDQFQLTCEAIKERWQKNTNDIHIFSVGTMKEENNNSSGHWFMLAAQKRGLEKRYFVADSLGTDRSHDPHVKQLLTTLNTPVVR